MNFHSIGCFTKRVVCFYISESWKWDKKTHIEFRKTFYVMKIYFRFVSSQDNLENMNFS